MSDLESAPSRRGVGTIVALLAVIFLARSIAVLGINSAEYTDGILMVGRDLFGVTYWPVGYTWAAWAAALLFGGDAEAGGRLVSAVCGALAVLPIAYLTLWAAGLTAASANAARRQRLVLLAGLCYLASPIPWRWSIRVMSDAMFLFLFWSALALLARAWTRAEEEDSPGWCAATWFTTANVVGLLAAFTRNQGIFYVPIAAVGVGWLYLQRRGAEKPKPLASGRGAMLGAALSVALWAAWPAVQAPQFVAHVGQVIFRTGGEAQPDAAAAVEAAAASAGHTWEPALQVWAMIEAYAYLSLFFFTPLLVIFAVAGIFVGNIDAGRYRPGLAAALIISAMILGSQAAFQSFLARYLLPLVPIVCIFAAFGAERLLEAAPRIGRALFGLAVAWGLFFGGASIWLQREAFGDIREAAEALRAIDPPPTVIYSNETYKPEAGLGAIKLTWWSRYPVLPLSALPAVPPPGSVVVLCSAYGGPEGYRAMRNWLQREHGAEVAAGPFNSRLVPILPDIMQSPAGGHQSPMAWIQRYAPQRFQTVILRLN